MQKVTTIYILVQQSLIETNMTACYQPES